MITKKLQTNGAGSHQTIMREGSTNRTREFARMLRRSRHNEHWTEELEDELLEAGWCVESPAAFVAQVNAEIPRYLETLRALRSDRQSL